MSSITVSSLLGDLSRYTSNPEAGVRVALSALTAVNNGTVEFLDATNPFVQALEVSVVNTAMFLQQNAALHRRLHPKAATDMADLHLHMADTDYVNIFALPTTAIFYMVIQESELLNAMIEDAATGISQVTIPRNSIFYAADIPFSLQYPIHIRQLQHGGLQAVFDATQSSPLQNLDTNVLPLETVTDATGVKYIKFSFLATQFDILTRTTDVNSTGGFTTKIAFDDEFYYCRVYRQDGNGRWVEMQTTFTEMVYDVDTPTAVLSVDKNTLTCTIPVVYVTTNQVRGKVRIDIYKTKGNISMYMGDYQPSDFKAKWLHIDPIDASLEVAAMSKLRNYLIWSQDTAIGGRSALPFDEVRARVLTNSIGPRQIPITPAQIQTSLVDAGYDIVKNVDTYTGRALWAAKALPNPGGANTYTPASASMLRLVGTMQAMKQGYGVTSHATGLTVTSSALLNTNNGKTTLMSTAQYNQLTTKPLSEQATLLNDGDYSFTPFYYVLDDTTDAFLVRPYFLDYPSIQSRSFVKENATTGLQVSIGSSSIAKTTTGYRLVLTTTSNDAYQELEDNKVSCQLAFTSNAQNGVAFYTGIQELRVDDAGERTFVFNIHTDYDINTDHRMNLTGFEVDGLTKIPRADLTQVFSIYFSTTTPMPNTYSTSSIDSQIGINYLPAGSIGITVERLKIQFGAYLNTLWNSYRSFASEIDYQTYDADVPAVYEEDVYEKDIVTGSIFSFNTDGTLRYNLLHAAGDVRRDAQGNVIYAYRAGDPVVDAQTGKPQPLTNYNAKLKRSLDLFVIDAVYSFANDTITTSYLKSIKTALLSWLTDDLVELNKQALERTEISFYPKTTKGVISVKTGNNVQESIEAAQSLTVTYYVTDDVYTNPPLLATIETSTIKAIGAYFAANTTVSSSGVLKVLRDLGRDDIVDVNVDGLAGRTGDVVLTVMDSSTRLSVGKVLSVQANSQLAVKDDLSVNFIIHNKFSY